MEARCHLGEKKRTHLIRLQASTSDRVAVLAALGLAAVAIGLSVVRADQRLLYLLCRAL
jgi:hypothetical protein